VKQTIFLAALTAFGAIGAFVIEPFVGVAVYYLFAVLRPQYLWKWALPEGIQWSEMVGWATVCATGWFLLTGPTDTPGEPRRRFSGAHKAFLVFGAWICVTYITSQVQDVAWPFFIDYLKIFLMFIVATLVVRSVRQVWWIYILSTASLIYIAYEMNYVYITAYRLDIYHNGYGGLDNNGAGLMLAMAVPLAIHGWEASTSKWRWLLIAGVPVLIHAVLMSYSRGAMLSLVVAIPVIILRSRRKRQFAFVLVALLWMIPYLAGDEIRDEFFSMKKYDTDSSANQRFDSWAAAVAIANEYPVFGAGIRNSSLLTLEHGADRAGRVIHSQYLQYLADAGYPGLTLYLVALGSLWVTMARTRRMLKRTDVPDAKRAHSMLNGVEGAMFVFCVGASFLSLEVFELPYVMALLGAQISLLTRLQPAEARATVSAVDAASVPFPIAHRA
jgi:probable O-glycosylation ligase (exosortase A-associated)